MNDYKGLEIEALFDLSKTISSDYLMKHQYPWQALEGIRQHILQMGKTLDINEYIKKDNNVWVHKTAKIADSALLGANIIICKNADIRHCANIREDVIIGDGCVVGTATEIKNAILFEKVEVPHYNYIGDSILGYKAHFGAGAITSNLRSDKQNIIIAVGKQKMQTQRLKFGAAVGDFVEIGCNAVLNPGSVVGKSAQIYPLSMVRGFVPEKHIYKNRNEIVELK